MRFRSLIAVGATLGATLLVGLPNAAQASGGPGPVSITPVSWTPSIATSGTDGSVETIRQLVPCGNLMYAVGTFTQISQGGATYTRNNAFSFDAATGAMTSWAPSITPGNVGTTGSGAVNSIALSADCSTAYLGGVFTAVNGSKVTNIAAVNATTGTLITTFAHSATGQVATLVRAGTHLIAGGYFTAINGSTKQYLASLSLTTGLDDGYANLGISGNYQYQDAGGSSAVSNATRIWNFALSPDGTKLLATGDFMTVAGQSRQQIFMLDLGATAATLDPWYSPEFSQYCATVEPFYLQDASWAPDMSAIYAATTGYKPASGPGYNTGDPRAGLCDAVSAFPTTASSTVSHLWVNYTGCDSLFSTAADATTVYIGGHERFANNPNGCDGAGPGAVNAPGMAGFNPTTGQLTANPTRDRGNGADDEVITAAGLWIASDNASGANTCGVTSTGIPATGHAGLCFLPYTTPAPPVASFISSCTGLTCFFDASATTAPSGAPVSYAWTFGDGATGTGVNPSHPYTGGGTYPVTVTATNAGGSSSASGSVSPVGVVAPTIAFVGTTSTNANATSDTVTVPAAVTAGNAELLVATAANASTMTAPAGWTLVDTQTSASITTMLWQRVAAATDAGSAVTVTFPAIIHGTVQLLAYSGTNTASPVVAYAKNTKAVSATTFTTPTATTPANGDVVVSVWTTKSSAVNAWTAPAGQNVRSTANGTGSGRINALASDGGTASAGSAGGLTASTDVAGTAFAGWTIVLG